MNLPNLEKLLQLARTQVVLRYAERSYGGDGSYKLEVDIDAFVVSESDFLHLFQLRKGSALWSVPKRSRLRYFGACVGADITNTAVQKIFEDDRYASVWDSPKPFVGILQPFDREFALQDISLVGLMHLVRFQTMLACQESELAIDDRLRSIISDRLKHISSIFSI